MNCCGPNLLWSKPAVVQICCGPNLRTQLVTTCSATGHTQSSCLVGVTAQASWQQQRYSLSNASMVNSMVHFCRSQRRSLYPTFPGTSTTMPSSEAPSFCLTWRLSSRPVWMPLAGSLFLRPRGTLCNRYDRCITRTGICCTLLTEWQSQSEQPVSSTTVPCLVKSVAVKASCCSLNLSQV